MNSVQVVCLVTATVLLTFVGSSNAVLDTDLKNTSETAKYVTSQKFQDAIEKMIMTSSDESNLVAKAIMDAIRQAALKCQNDGVPSLAISKSMESILSTVRIIAAAERSFNRSIEKALDMAAQNREAAINTIKTAIASITDFLFIAGLPIHGAQGSALAFVGGAAIKDLKNAEISVLTAGFDILAGYENAEKLAVLGMRAGGLAAKAGVEAARAAVASGEKTAYAHILKTAQYVFDGMRTAVSKGINQNDLVSGIERSLKNFILIESLAGLDSINRLNNGHKSVVKTSTYKTAIDAATIMKTGIIATISENGNAIASLKNVLRYAEKLAIQDSEAALSLLSKGFETATVKYIIGSGSAFLGMGAAGRMLGDAAIEALFPALLKIEYGVVAAYNEMMVAKDLAFNDFRLGGVAAISSAIKSCEAAENALFTYYADAGAIGFEILQNLREPTKSGTLISFSLGK